MAAIFNKVITEDTKQALAENVKEEEVKQAMFQLGAWKSPALDGFAGIFLQTFRDAVKAGL